MAPFVVLAGLFGICSAAGYFGWPAAFGWWTSLRIALAGMFLLTASAHWGKRRPDLIRMIPPSFPRPDLLVTLTGFLEIAGAVGLMWMPLSRYAAGGLFLMLLAVLPANIHAAREHLTIAGRAVPALLPRMLLQLVFLGALAGVILGPGN